MLGSPKRPFRPATLALRAVQTRAQLGVRAVRDSFVVLLPFTMFGVVAVLLPNSPWPGLQQLFQGVFGSGWASGASMLVRGTQGVAGAALAVLVSMQLARRLPVPAGGAAPAAQTVGIGALESFTICLLVDGQTQLASMGYGDMFSGIVCGVTTAEIVQLVLRVRMPSWLELPYDVGALTYHATKLTLPIAASGVLTYGVAGAVASWHGPHQDVLAPLATLAAHRGAGVWWLRALATLVNQSLWFMGMHGGNVLNSYGAVFFSPAGAPIDGSLASHPLFNAFALAAGCGATLGLVLAMLFTAKDGPQRHLAQWSLLPSVFNVNELLVF